MMRVEATTMMHVEATTMMRANARAAPMRWNATASMGLLSALVAGSGNGR